MRAKRIDNNHRLIRDALRKVGWLDVMDCSMFGRGFPDLLVLNKDTGQIHFLEIKGKRGKLTDRQQELKAIGWPLVVVRTINEAFKACGVEIYKA